jgi:hypothetical protein
MTTPFTLYRQDGTQITAWEMWTRPKMPHHWAPDRSAMELAKAWFRDTGPSPPEELIQLLHSSNRLAGLRFVRGIPELVTSLPERGEGRNHDLWLLGQTNLEKVTICIEAKADEPFGNETVAEYRMSAMKRRESGESTRALERIAKLLALVPACDSRWDNIRYQLLTAICGTAIQAKHDGSTLAIFVVHEFHTCKTNVDNIRKNAKDFEAFMSVINASSSPVIAGVLYGPIIVGGVDCLIGKIVK